MFSQLRRILQVHFNQTLLMSTQVHLLMPRHLGRCTMFQAPFEEMPRGNRKDEGLCLHGACVW